MATATALTKSSGKSIRTFSSVEDPHTISEYEQQQDRITQIFKEKYGGKPLSLGSKPISSKQEQADPLDSPPKQLQPRGLFLSTPLSENPERIEGMIRTLERMEGAARRNVLNTISDSGDTPLTKAIGRSSLSDAIRLIKLDASLKSLGTIWIKRAAFLCCDSSKVVKEEDRIQAFKALLKDVTPAEIGSWKMYFSKLDRDESLLQRVLRLGNSEMIEFLKEKLGSDYSEPLVRAYALKRKRETEATLSLQQLEEDLANLFPDQSHFSSPHVKDTGIQKMSKIKLT